MCEGICKQLSMMTVWVYASACKICLCIVYWWHRCGLAMSAFRVSQWPAWEPHHKSHQSRKAASHLHRWAVHLEPHCQNQRCVVECNEIEMLIDACCLMSIAALPPRQLGPPPFPSKCSLLSCWISRSKYCKPCRQNPTALLCPQIKKNVTFQGAWAGHWSIVMYHKTIGDESAIVVCVFLNLSMCEWVLRAVVSTTTVYLRENSSMHSGGMMLCFFLMHPWGTHRKKLWYLHVSVVLSDAVLSQPRTQAVDIGPKLNTLSWYPKRISNMSASQDPLHSGDALQQPKCPLLKWNSGLVKYVSSMDEAKKTDRIILFPKFCHRVDATKLKWIRLGLTTGAKGNHIEF